MQYALINPDGRLAALSVLDSAEDWTYPEGFYVVEAEDFIPDPVYEFEDYVYSNGEFVSDENGPVEREAKRQLQADEVLIALFKAQPETLASFPDEALTHMASYMQEWELGVGYSIGDMRQYDEYPYRCVQAHTSQTGYEPDIAVSLWARILPGQDGEIGEWIQPDSTNPYMTGDMVTHNGKTWRSLIDNNVWEPGVAGSEVFWEEVVSGESVEPTEPTEPAEPIEPETPEGPAEWSQPDSTNPYMQGDRVSHNGKVWESIYNYNVYEPGVAGWEEVIE